ncbi:MAG: hypothetical protein ABJB55_07535 [Actinomycetota bacterium]
MNPMLAHTAGTDETLSLILLFSGLWVGWIGWSRLRGTGFDRMPGWGGWTLIGVAVTLAVAATTVPRALLGPTATASTPTGPRPTTTATLRFLWPRSGFVTSEDQLTARLELTGATITPATSTSVSPDTGHLHLSLDGALVSMTGSTLRVVDLRSVMPGTHTLTATFVAADHLPFDPPVQTELTFEKVATP